MSRKRLTLLVALLLCLTSFLPVASQLSGDYDLSWWTVDGGGGTLSDGAYSLSGTVGQPDAGQALSGNGYTLVGGF